MHLHNALFGLLLCCYCAATCAEIVTGTGFFVSGDGHFATNWHVVDRATEILVQDHTGVRYPATIVGSDPANDLTVLRVSEKPPASLSIIESSAVIRRGAEVITVGYPMLSIQGTEPKITNGIINSLSGINDDPRMYQISVPVQPGNSGGALVTIDGLVVGVVTAKLSASNTLKTTGSLPENVNYAVKSNYLLELLRSHKVRAKVETRASGKELRLVDLAARVEKATGLIIVKNKVVRRGSPEVEQEIERQCQHERTYRGKAAFERCAEDVVNQINRDAK